MGHKSDGNVFGGAASPPAAYSLRNKSRRVHVPVKSKQRTVYILMCAPQIPRSFPSFGTCYARWFAILDLPTLYSFTSCNAWRWRWISASKRAKDLLRYREMGIMHPLRWFLHLIFWGYITADNIFFPRKKEERAFNTILPLLRTKIWQLTLTANVHKRERIVWKGQNWHLIVKLDGNMRI